jgi:hypothetical protein
MVEKGGFSTSAHVQEIIMHKNVLNCLQKSMYSNFEFMVFYQSIDA